MNRMMRHGDMCNFTPKCIQILKKIIFHAKKGVTYDKVRLVSVSHGIVDGMSSRASVGASAPPAHPTQIHLNVQVRLPDEPMRHDTTSQRQHHATPNRCTDSCIRFSSSTDLCGVARG